jgi:hypothetical protein
MGVLKTEKKHAFEWSAMIIFTLYMAVCLYTHEPWLDEAQSFLLVRDLSLPDLLKQLRYEGHPAVWYLLLFPFIKLGCPIIIQNILSSVCACIAVYQLLFHAPLTKTTKLAAILASPVLFNYSVIGRSYCLVLLFVFVVLAVFKERYNKHYLIYALSLGLLINTSLYAAVAAGAFLAADIIVFLIKKDYARLKSKEFIITFAIVFISAAVMVITLYPGDYYSTYLEYTESSYDAIGTVQNWNNIFYAAFRFPYIILSAFEIHENVLAVLAAFCLCVFTGSLFFMAAGEENKEAYYAPVFFTIFYAVLFILILFTDRFLIQHGGMVLLACWAAVWILTLTGTRNEKSLRRFRFVFSFIMILFCLREPVAAVTDLVRPYSGARDAAAFLAKNGYDSEDTLLVTIDVLGTNSILAHLENIGRSKSPLGYGSYVDFRKWYSTRDLLVSSYDFNKLVGSDRAAYKHILIIIRDDYIKPWEVLPYEEIFSSRRDYGENPALAENFRIFLMK